MLGRPMRAMRVRQGILKAKVSLGDASKREQEYYAALVRHYGTDMIAGRVCQKYLDRVQVRLEERAVDLAEVVLNVMTNRA